MIRKIHMEGGDATTAAKRTHQRLGAHDLFNKVTPLNAKFAVQLGTNTDRTIRNFANDRSEGQILLLVDSDGDVEGDQLAYLRSRNKELPVGVSVDDVHLMTHSMETWLVADSVGLSKTYPKLNAAKLPSGDLERRERKAIEKALEGAIGEPYNKIFGMLPCSTSIRPPLRPAAQRQRDSSTDSRMPSSHATAR